MSDVGIGGGKNCCRHPPSSIVDNVFDCGGALSSSNHGRRCRGIIVSLPPSLSRGGAPLNPDGEDDNKDDDNRSLQDRATGMWAL